VPTIVLVPAGEKHSAPENHRKGAALGGRGDGTGRSKPHGFGVIIPS